MVKINNMKVKQVTKKDRFKPVTIEITIETEKELLNLWNRMNVSPSIISSASSHNNVPFDKVNDGEVTLPVWQELNNIKKERKL